MRKVKSLLERFAGSHQIDSSGCWIWTRHLNEKGYGVFGLPGGKKMKAHRLSYLLFRGELPHHLHVCHRCDNPKCVNPDHLYLGTQSENIQEMHDKGRWKLSCAKLNPLYVTIIREALLLGHTQSAIGRYFGAKQQTISDVATNKKWTRV